MGGLQDKGGHRPREFGMINLHGRHLTGKNEPEYFTEEGFNSGGDEEGPQSIDEYSRERILLTRLLAAIWGSGN